MSSNSKTATEAVLSRFSDRTFLWFWSYPNLYTDRKLSKNGEGKEFCDHAVFFGNDILIFSDKNIFFDESKDIQLSWSRWYKRSVEESAKQIIGAENWIKKHPDRVFTDKQCQIKLPLDLNVERATIHRIVTVNGISDGIRKFKKTGIPSLIINGSIGISGKSSPFVASQPLENGPYFHILDESALTLIFDELDTPADFISYLKFREKLLDNKNCIVCANGEDDLLYVFKTNPSFLPPAYASALMIPAGLWSTFTESKEYRFKKEADRRSYVWDRLIQHFASSFLAKHNPSAFAPGR